MNRTALNNGWPLQFIHQIRIQSFLIFFVLVYLPSFAQYPVQQSVSSPINRFISGYLVWLPTDYAKTPAKKYPLLIFLHGIKESGNGSKEQLSKLLTIGPPKLISEKKFPTKFVVGTETFSLIVLSPQFNSNARNAANIDSLINFALKTFRVDSSRIYMTGVSMGGGIAWLYAGTSIRFARRLAGLVDICGNTKAYPQSVKNIMFAHLPVIAIHREGDSVVPSQYSKEWVKQLNTRYPMIQPKATLIILEGNSHDAWTDTYDPDFKLNGKNVYEWLLTYKRTEDGIFPPGPKTDFEPLPKPN